MCHVAELPGISICFVLEGASGSLCHVVEGPGTSMRVVSEGACGSMCHVAEDPGNSMARCATRTRQPYLSGRDNNQCPSTTCQCPCVLCGPQFCHPLCGSTSASRVLALESLLKFARGRSFQFSTILAPDAQCMHSHLCCSSPHMSAFHGSVFVPREFLGVNGSFCKKPALLAGEYIPDSYAG
jgi:hypothetical protein